MSRFNSKRSHAKQDLEDVLLIVIDKAVSKGVNGYFLVNGLFKEIQKKKQNIKRRFLNE